MKEHLFICGMMGSGKTTVGQELAKQLDLPFIDTDRWIQGFRQQSISQIFQEKGEAYFRQLEIECITELANNTKSVISLGGGSLSQAEILPLIHSFGILIYLNGSIEWLYQFVSHDKKRPLLLSESGEMCNESEIKERLSALFAKRRLAYETASIQIITDKKTISEIVQEIKDQL